MTEGVRKYHRSTMTVTGIANMVSREIALLQPLLWDALTVSGYASYYEGMAEVLAQLPAPRKRVTPGFTQKALGTLTELVTPPNAHLVKIPALSDALSTVGSAVALQGTNYRVTGQLVKRGAFAVTSQLSDKGILFVRDTVHKALDEGWGTKHFVEVLTDHLSGEDSPLAEHHLENVFRTNVLTYLSQGKFTAAQQPLVKSHFPYCRYSATRDARVRKEHWALESLGLDGTAVYNLDDPVFIKFRPPWSWNCRCNWYPVTVEQAARYGVKEAQEWWSKAVELAAKQKKTLYEILESVRPAKMQFVDHPPFEPDPAFDRTLA